MKLRRMAFKKDQENLATERQNFTIYIALGEDHLQESVAFKLATIAHLEGWEQYVDVLEDCPPERHTLFLHYFYVKGGIEEVLHLEKGQEAFFNWKLLSQ